MPCRKLAATISIHSGVFACPGSLTVSCDCIFQDLVLVSPGFFSCSNCCFFCWCYGGENTCLTNWYLLLIHCCPLLTWKIHVGSCLNHLSACLLFLSKLILWYSLVTNLVTSFIIVINHIWQYSMDQKQCFPCLLNRSFKEKISLWNMQTF